MPFDIETPDSYGREGVLVIDDREIKTPNYIPNQKDVNGLVKSPFVNSDNKPKMDVSDYTHWLEPESLNRICGDRVGYNGTKNYLKSQLKELEKFGAKKKLLHFEFYGGIETLTGQELDVLLKLQYDVGADVIEIPNLFSVDDYRIVIDKASQFCTAQGFNKELMGIANEGRDIDLLKSKIGLIDSIGANLKYENSPLLIAIKNNLRDKEIWVHGLSVPRSYRVVKWNGTISVLLNYYGVDTISSYVGHPKGARAYRFKFDGMTESEKKKQTEDAKYFNPIDYSTTRYKNMDVDQKLSDFCQCPVCRANRVQNITQNVDTANANVRSHEVFAYKNESTNYQSVIKRNQSENYFNSKRYAKEISDRFMRRS